MIVAEGASLACRPGACLGLQWGRNLIVAEGMDCAGRQNQQLRCFNGAAT